MPNFNTAFPSRFLSAGDIDAPYDAVIAKVTMENVGPDDKPEKKLVAFFEDPDHKAIVLNRTRCESVAELANTPDYAKWPGTKVRISKGTTFFSGKRVACIVVDAPELPF